MNTCLLLTELQSKYGFDESRWEELLAHFSTTTATKNQILFKAGDIVTCTYFVIKGCLRLYYVSPEGVERTIYIAEERAFISDHMSCLHDLPTKFNIQALEDSELLMIDRPNWEHAITTIPDFTLYYIKNHQRVIAALREELGKNKTETPDEKYERLLTEKPHLLQRLPLYHIAAYLGVTQETLSRVRKRRSQH
ncbi:MAG: Crp/Fnr family transcriptional regulator [Bacteroidota bacterium]